MRTIQVCELDDKTFYDFYDAFKKDAMRRFNLLNSKKQRKKNAQPVPPRPGYLFSQFNPQKFELKIYQCPNCGFAAELGNWIEVKREPDSRFVSGPEAPEVKDAIQNT